MKKTFITVLSVGLLAVTGLKAQTVEEGIRHMYADRYKSAIVVFEKILAADPNNVDAIFWLGQTYFDYDKNDKAKEVYQNALNKLGSQPLILVGLGHADLLDHKTADARQKFEAALTASQDKKGKNDPTVLTAIGRANVDAKAGDYKWAVQLLEEANDKGKKNPETLLQLGNAYRKADPGQGGSEAYKMYKKALDEDKSFVVAYLRLAKLFESQKNWDLVLENLNDAVKKDPTFSPAYYELFYYYFYRSQIPEAEEQLKKYVASADQDPQNDFLYAQLCYVKKDLDCAISKAEGVVAATGESVKPKVLKLLADSYFQKEEYTNAKKYIDWYFRKREEKPEEVISFDYKLKADILSKTGGTDEEILSTYTEGVKVDTVLTSKIDFLKQGAKFFKEAEKRDKEAILLTKIIELKKEASINDYFELMLAQYFNKNHEASRQTSLTMESKFPDQVYGFEWAYNNAVAITTDTLKSDSVRAELSRTIGAPDATRLYEFAQKDTVKYIKQYINAVRYLAAYYINEEKNKEKSLEFFKKWQSADVANAENIQKYIEQIEKMPGKPRP
ncbi:MAG TPA: tetratricopeptide repeat protein [Chitinophagaceae bacterium]|nr:tetratricopeptide repeat protein [Chitinophagaceae bacterium]MCB9054407.1 tetratricopeptide repeat protein [Chitinophagales bacterium]HPG12542.1 tetratricopeptide repeat protein [Chitinophagaceae bacterium]HRX94549.1 tetratricopeptide repeat protein [Chitinophagaceae bacterium]